MNEPIPAAVPFTEKDIKAYLDGCITIWRIRRDHENSKIASYYIDCFQSVRISIFGELLPEETDHA